MSINLYRSKIERLTQDQASLEKDVAREQEKIAKLHNGISSIQGSITKSTSVSTLKSKQGQIDAKQKELAQCQKKLADLKGKISTKVTELHRNLKNLEQAEEQDRKKQGSELKKRESESKKRREEELRHARDVTRETEKQMQLQAQIKNSRLVIDFTRLPETIKVLFMASNPIDKTPLRLDEEIRAITEKIRMSEYRDSVHLISRWAARPLDLIQALNEHQPHIVHFSGHGSDNDELIFQSDDGKAKIVSKEAIVATMGTCIDNIRVVIFNACFSEAQAQAITQHVDVAIGMKDTILDNSAKHFAAQFYSSIGFGHSIQRAFDQGVAALLLEGVAGSEVPVLFTHEDVNADEIFLVRPEAQSSVIQYPHIKTYGESWQ